MRVLEAARDLDESQWLVDEIRHHVREGGSRSEVAVLYRSNAQSRLIETALFNAAIPYRVCTAGCASSSVPKSSTPWLIFG